MQHKVPTHFHCLSQAWSKKNTQKFRQTESVIVGNTGQECGEGGGRGTSTFFLMKSNQSQVTISWS